VIARKHDRRQHPSQLRSAGRHDLSIVGEVEIAVEHCLLVNQLYARAIRRIPSTGPRPMRDVPARGGVEIVATADTTGSAKPSATGGSRRGGDRLRRAAESLA
jgi:prephenate dehydratase